MVIGLFRRITEHFDSGVLTFNDYGPVSRANQLAGRLITSGKQMIKREDISNSPHSQWNFPGFKDPRHPQSWNPKLRLLEARSVFLEPEAELFPPMLRFSARLARRVPSIARKARVLSYRF